MKITVNGKLFTIFIALLFIFALISTGISQTGGGFDLTHSTISSSSSSQSTNGTVKLDGTLGQTSSGTNSSGGSFSLRGGFWAFNANAPTGANVVISGQVATIEGEAVEGVQIVLTDVFTNTIRVASLNKKGHFSFEELEINHFYIITVISKKYILTPQSYFFELISNRTDVNFTVIGENQ